MRLFWGLTLLWTISVIPALGQGWGTLEGRILEADTSQPIPGVTILVVGTNYGTATKPNGTYSLTIPDGRYALRFSAVGFVAVIDSVTIRRGRTTTLNKSLETALIEMDEVTVEGADGQHEAGVHEIDPRDVQNIPAPMKDGFRVLKVMPGVAANNELSNQYSVRGGGFNENLIFLNGFEVYMPFRPRQGEQEGLGLLNPALTDRITFYTGGFPARYGGKLSSALEVQYHRPENQPIAGAAYASLLDAGLHASASALQNRLGWSLGLRKARARRFFATQELKGDYNPDYTDIQGYFSYRLAPGHELEALGIWATHTFNLNPNNSRTYFGTVSLDNRTPSNFQSLWIDFSGQEQDGYSTGFSGLRLTNQISPRLRAAHDVAYFQTVEDEFFNIRGTAVLYQVDPGSGDANSGAGHLPTGTSQQDDGADNRVSVGTWTGQSRWMFATRRHAAEAGGYFRHLTFDDRLQEKSVVVGQSTEGDVIRIVVDSLHDSATLTATQAGFYVQDAFDVLTGQPERLLLTVGLRTDYFSFNDEWAVSPRLSTRFLLSEQTTLTGSWGVYYQAPTYRELRGRPLPGETILGALNEHLKSQRSMQLVGGMEHFLPSRRLYLRAEAYYKRIQHVISYDIDNVRVRYSGENDARSTTYGLDFQLRGEFVPGLESWINYSYLVANESFLPAFQTPYNTGTVARPTDQRHTVSLFIQDYIPDDPTWKIHLRTLFGSGLPYTPPVPGPRLGNVVLQLPGDRFSARFPRYFRFDLGATKHIIAADKGLHNPLQVYLTAEVLNVFNMINTVAYSWVPDLDGIWTRIPTRLTPRTLNVRLRIEF